MISVDSNLGTFYNQGGLPYSTRPPHEIRMEVVKHFNMGIKEVEEDEEDI